MFDFFKFIFDGFPENMKYYQYWDGTTNESSFVDDDIEPIVDNLHLKLNEYKDRFVKYNWVNDIGNFTPPIYSLNKHGFRTDIEYKNGIPIAIGCSNTFGKGNHKINTWPDILSKKINEDIINLGICGGSMDSSYRVLKSYLESYNPGKVFFLIPNAFRAEYYVRLDEYQPTNVHIQIGPNFHRYDEGEKSKVQKYLFDKIYSLDESVYLNFHKNLDAIRYLCEKNNIKLVELLDPCMWNQDGIMDNSELDIDKHFSFDLNHFGPEFQEWVSDLFLKKIENNLEN